MARPRTLVGEKKEQAAKMLADGFPRKKVCKDLGISYQQLAREFGNAWKQTPAESPESVN